MTTAIYTATIFGDTYKLRGDFSEASSQIERWFGEDGVWQPTGWQTAQFTHRPHLAMEMELEHSIELGGDDPEDFRDEINTAIEAMTCE